ncbi:hypothetical protein PybrP1_008465 [[Pythium] brassicae (nom. inval.)]|nr:hypothetical protein PybrP1_008465 [[Pythium] brassicae (nom. inval.)]
MVVLATLATAEDDTMRKTVDIAGHKHLADATALVNKNAVIHSNNIAVTRSNILSRQNDDISLETDANTDTQADTEGTAAPPTEVIETGEKEALAIPDHDGLATTDSEHREFAPGYYGYRYRFYYPYGRGFRYGWRYPMPYWNLYGRRYYGVGCGYGRAFGGYYYC